ncbi:serine hydrolase domain-containing protein [Tahibacter amnicola]|uniref:Beta-lactamase family protein n=1 Tax=Tahibacter amnicola TaxID=2976241 RepID=A0ABY6BH89_9GAMM|nr:serine hydrolase domain-containing protein [Tahibacter amnicola]UXI69383.1 beta-lactamase family protein [Tahibacter amnicola]
MRLKRFLVIAACLILGTVSIGTVSARTPTKREAARAQAAATQRAKAKATKATKARATKAKAAAVPAAAVVLAAPAPNAGLTAATELNAWLDAVEASGQVAGLAVAVVQGDQVLLQRGVGFADAANRTPVTPSTVFRLASLSKSFAATLAGMLVDKGYLDWQTRVGSILPTFALKDTSAAEKLSIRDILSHRVGLPHNTYDHLLEQDQPYPVLVDRLKEVDPICGVGDCYSYQNIAFSLLGDVTYAVTGDFFYHQVEKRIFHPLGMTTATYGRDALESSPEWARPHTRRGRSWVPFQPRESYYHVAPAAGVNASIKDMSNYLIAHMGGRPDVIPPQLLNTLHTPVVTTPTEMRSSPWRRGRLRNAQYALGWRVYDYAGVNLVFHAGAVQGYRGIIAFFPEYRFGTVMLWNCETSLPTGLLPMLLDRYLGLPQVDWAGIEILERTRVANGGAAR